MEAKGCLHTQLHDITTCSICLETFKEPKSLPCLHTFCLHCIEDYCKGKKEGQEATCPLCRQVFFIPDGGVKNLPIDLLINPLLHPERPPNNADADNTSSAEFSSVTEDLTEMFGNQSAYSKEDLDHLKNVYKSEGLVSYMSQLKKRIDQWKTVPLKIGVIGSAGAGKSSFVNAIRGLHSKNVGAAPVNVTETTTKPTEYPHPNNKMIKFWDLPGAGTPTFQRKTYLEHIGVDDYDCFVIVSVKRFTEDDLWFGKEIDQRKKHFYFVRTHIHSDIENDKDDRVLMENDAVGVMSRIRSNTIAQLKNFQLDRPIFLIDNKHPELYDFEALQEVIIKDLPDRKRESMILSMSTITQSIFKLKVEELRKRANFLVLVSMTIALVPGCLLAFNINIMRIELKFYYSQLGLDDDSLKKLAEVTSRDYHQLKAIVTREFPCTDGYDLLLLCSGKIWYKNLLTSTKKLLNTLLDIAEKTSLEIYQYIT